MPLRTLRLVAVATADYTALYARGAVDTAAARDSALVGINRTLRYVNEITARDLGVVFTLIAASRSLLFVGANPARFAPPRAAAPGQAPSDDGAVILRESRAVVDSLLPPGTPYDVAHVFGVGGTSWAEVGALCDTARMTQGVSLVPFRRGAAAAPLTDEEELYFATDVVAHEIGHQLGATHTFNTVADECADGRWGPTAFEPGSGSTVMAYPGLCESDLVQWHAGPYYHAASIQQVRDLLAARAPACGVPRVVDNRAPRVTAAPRRVFVPRATPFRLTARGDDPEQDPVYYTWEEYARSDWAPAASPPLGDDDGHVRPLFRSFPPDAAPTRTLPGLVALASGQAPYESLPSGAVLPRVPGMRRLTCRVTARDWRGGVAFDDVAVDVVPTAGPFRVTVPAAGTQQVVRWRAARTTEAPLHCATVRVTLVAEPGGPYDVVLAPAVPNRAEQVTVRVPRMLAARAARVQVACADGAFFGLSSGDVEIVATADPAGRPARPRAVRRARTTP
ncbi:reprolysin-like metallopeptidase [Roseisolibacter agri]|uniref:reprolysin-like metallopeptidase n=1 Tax=Roseisolibacter agri TaxID=2014610 RepID=UPI0024E15F1B|nr:M12 family metallo-peptidase [Roseisolibacter agri]